MGSTHRCGATGMLLAAWLSPLASGCQERTASEGRTYSVGGTVEGLANGGLVLTSPGLPDLSVIAGTRTFSFAREVPTGTAYHVAVGAQPLAQACTVSDGSGVVRAADVVDVRVVCGGVAIGGPGPFVETGGMRRGRAASTATLLMTGEVLVAGGCGAEVPDPAARAAILGSCPATATAELYDPGTGRFTPTADMSTRRVAHTATLLPDGRVLIAGGRPVGYGEAGALTMLSTAELYDPATGEFQATGSMGAGRALHAAVLLADGKVLVTGGIGDVPGSGLLASAEVFDPGVGEFLPAGTMAQARAAHAAVRLDDGRVLLCSANDPIFAGLDPPASGAELYDPATGTSEPAGDAPTVGTAALLDDGRVLVVGYETAVLYDPVTGAFQPTGARTQPRRWGSVATRLADGSVLVTGGWPDGDALAGAERYDPHTRAFAPAGNMVETRWGHSATLLPGGAVLVVGSGTSLWTNARPYLAASPTAELYFPDSAGTTLAIAAGSSHMLAVREGGVLWAWGENSAGQLGDGTRERRTSPVRIGAGFTAVSAGGGHSLAVKADGSLWAWGSNHDGQVGDGGTADERTVPVQIGSGFAEVSAGAYHSLAMRADGSVWEWGNAVHPSPVAIGEGFAVISAGGAFSLAVKVDGTLWAWGENGLGQLGDGTLVYRDSPSQVGSGFARVSAGGVHALGVKRDGTLWAWGYNGDGQLGDGTREQRLAPVRIGEGFVRVAAGQTSSLGVKADGTLWAWGSGLWLGEEGPIVVPTLLGGGYHSVAVGWPWSLKQPRGFLAASRLDGSVWMWGGDCLGQPRTAPLGFPGQPVMFR